MYLFDLEDFKCDQLPDDWEDYGNSIRAIFDSTIKCLAELIETSDVTEEIKETLNSKLQELYSFYINDVKVKLALLIAELADNPAGSTCFNKTLYTNYIASFNTANDLVLEINGLLTFGDDAIGYDFDIDVDTTLIYPTTGSSYNKVIKCVGVYMKQMDFGSEFIGSVRITETAPKVESYAIDWPGHRDGEWSVNR
jgi:hypothetical protein